MVVQNLQVTEHARTRSDRQTSTEVNDHYAESQTTALTGDRVMTSKRRVRLGCERLEERQLLSGDLYLTGIEWRTIEGTNNNLPNPTQGAAETRQIRFGYTAQFPDGFGDA